MIPGRVVVWFEFRRIHRLISTDRITIDRMSQWRGWRVPGHPRRARFGDRPGHEQSEARKPHPGLRCPGLDPHRTRVTGDAQLDVGDEIETSMCQPGERQ